MRGLVDQNLAVEFAGHWVEMQIGLLLRAEKGEARQEDQARPALAQVSRHLRQRQRTIGIGPEPLREIVDRLGGFVGYRLHVARRRGRRRSH